MIARCVAVARAHPAPKEGGFIRGTHTSLFWQQHACFGTRQHARRLPANGGRIGASRARWCWGFGSYSNAPEPAGAAAAGRLVGSMRRCSHVAAQLQAQDAQRLHVWRGSMEQQRQGLPPTRYSATGHDSASWQGPAGDRSSAWTMKPSGHRMQHRLPSCTPSRAQAACLTAHQPSMLAAKCHRPTSTKTVALSSSCCSAWPSLCST